MRYKQAFIGVAWSVIRPLVTMVVFVIVFGKIAKFPSPGVPYALLVYTGMVAWQFFASSLSDSSESLISNANLLTKTYFPRIIVPTSTVIVNLVDTLISLGILAGLMAWYKFLPGWQIIFLPVFLFLVMVASLGAGLWLAALNVQYRDFRYVVPFLVQFGLYVSPVGFSSSVVPQQWRLFYGLNPMVGIIEGFRWSILGQNTYFDVKIILLSILVTLVIFVSGLWYFRKVERVFADII